MVDAIRGTSANPAFTRRKERSQRFAVDMDAVVEADGREHSAHIQDISRTGAAIAGKAPKMTNQQFLDLHIEGYDRMQGRVVREFDGGYALQFEEDNGPAITEEELARFRKLASVNG